MTKLDRHDVVESPEYLRGYRDGQRDHVTKVRKSSGDGILGALLAIALLCGVGYLAYNYSVGNIVIPKVRIDTSGR